MCLSYPLRKRQPQYRHCFFQVRGTKVSALREDFIRFAVECGVLRFGEFVTKAGRTSPYFFNAGLFNDGQSLGKLADYYAETLLQSGVGFDMLFGPAYKGIPLVAAVSMALAKKGRNVPFAYNRKEAKDHGEGGIIVGAPLKGRVVIIDDVISAGTSVNESVGIIRKSDAGPSVVLIALDRMERSGKDDGVCRNSQPFRKYRKRMALPFFPLPIWTICSVIWKRPVRQKH